MVLLFFFCHLTIFLLWCVRIIALRVGPKSLELRAGYTLALVAGSGACLAPIGIKISKGVVDHRLQSTMNYRMN